MNYGKHQQALIKAEEILRPYLANGAAVYGITPRSQVRAHDTGKPHSGRLVTSRK